MANEPIRWGLLGTSRINEKLMRGAALTHAAEIVAVGSRSGTTGESYARANGINVLIVAHLRPSAQGPRPPVGLRSRCSTASVTGPRSSNWDGGVGGLGRVR